MIFRNFEELKQRVVSADAKKRVVVAAAQDEHTLEAVFQARRDGIVEPVLVGQKDKILAILEKIGEKLAEEFILDALDDTATAAVAVKLVNEGKADFIMKGKLQTADLLKAVVDKDMGLRTGNVMSHVAIHEIPGYHKLLAVTDGGMMMYPGIDEKRQIIDNAVNMFVAMGYECPKVAVLAAVENVNPKMQETMDACMLKEMNNDGRIRNCIVEGPISYDLAMSAESAAIKGYHSTVVADADILVVPNIAAGNILGKSLVYSANAKMAGFIAGARVPIVLTSRGASAEEKYLSLILSASAATTATATASV